MKKRYYLCIFAALGIGGAALYQSCSCEQKELLVCHPGTHKITVNWSALNSDNVNQQLDFGGGLTSRSPLMYAVCQNRADMVKRCLELGADTEARDSVEYYGSCRKTPLHAAVEIGNTEIIGMLVQAGANLESRIHRDGQVFVPGYTPLMWALYKGKTDAARYLLEQGADATALSAPLWRVESGMPEESVLQVALSHADGYELVSRHLFRTRLHRLLNPSFEWGCFSLPEADLQQPMEFNYSADEEVLVSMPCSALLRYLNSCYCILKISSVTDTIAPDGKRGYNIKRLFTVAEVVYSRAPMPTTAYVSFDTQRMDADVAGSHKEIPLEDVYICLKKEAFTRLDDYLYINYHEAWNDLWYLSGKSVTELLERVLRK